MEKVKHQSQNKFYISDKEFYDNYPSDKIAYGNFKYFLDYYISKLYQYGYLFFGIDEEAKNAMKEQLKREFGEDINLIDITNETFNLVLS